MIMSLLNNIYRQEDTRVNDNVMAENEEGKEMTENMIGTIEMSGIRQSKNGIKKVPPLPPLENINMQQ